MAVMRIAVAAVLAVATAAHPAAAAGLFPLSEVRPGLQGVGRTVFEGARVDEFQVRILGVLENAVGPRQSLILARLSGGLLQTNAEITFRLVGLRVGLQRRAVQERHRGGAVEVVGKVLFQGAQLRRLVQRLGERVRQVGPNTEGARGSYSIYRIAD